MYLFGKATIRLIPYRVSAYDIPRLPVDEKIIRNTHWKSPEEKIEKKCNSWQGRLVASVGKVTLILSSFTDIPNFVMYFYGMPMGVNKRREFSMAGLLWEEEANKKIILVKCS